MNEQRPLENQEPRGGGSEVGDSGVEAGDFADGLRAPCREVMDSEMLTAARVGELTDDVRSIRVTIQDIETRLQDRVSYEREMEQMFKALYSELESSRGDREWTDLRPLYLDLVRVTDRLSELAGFAEDSSSVSSARDEILEVLYRRGVEEFRAAGDEFDPAFQQIVGTKDTDRSDLNGHVAERTRPGFRCGARLLRAESVFVWKLRVQSK
jgi:molecular chaperone GrpE (heat shock protein)